MHTPTAPTVLLALALAACAGEATPVAPTRAPALARARAASQAVAPRPISGRCEVTFSPAPPPLPAPPLVRQLDVGTCQLSHLGRTAFSGVQEINFAAGTQQGERTLIAANGDILRATSTGTSAPGAQGQIRFSATMTFVGGTGRFANATGQAHVAGTADLASHTSIFTLEGSVAYDASDRSAP